MANPLSRRSGAAALTLTAFAALVIGCGGGGGGGGGTSSSGSTTASTTAGNTAGSTSASTTASGDATAGSIGGGTGAGASGNLPQNSIFYAENKGATFDVKYVREDGTTGGTYAADLPIGVAPASPDPSATGRFVFAAAPSGTAPVGIYRGTTTAVAGASVVVAPTYAEIPEVQVSRDGTRVVFLAATVAGGDLSLYSVSTTAGSTPTLVGLAYDGSLDTDGKRVVYSADGAGSTDLYVRDLATGTTSVTLTNTANVSEDEPQFSKKGDKVVFSEVVTTGSSATYRLGYVTVAGGATTQINPFPAAQDVLLFAPSFNGDGTRISFVAIDNGDGSNTGLYTCDLTGGTLTKVLASPQLLKSTYWTSLQGRSTLGLPLRLNVPRKR